ncbi:hypothetical protein HK100_003660 [Physocladia obscura]|uniref:Flavin reductase like domain-containing protein n=1 Tax=Physocladia obscura TaxID=109957 RepID=A0AAD5XJQ7_9FUNG|nr:hypothetical protein HK100_003660 [Physocladia obscura]
MSELKEFDASATFEVTKPPHPEWAPPQNQPLPAPFSSEREKVLAAKDIAPGDMYKLLTSAVIPRPIAFVSTASLEPNGPANIAPFSYFSVVCHDPPTLMVSISYSKGEPKDTLKNIQETGEFVVNSFNEHFVESANHCSIPVPYAVEEDKLSGLTLVPSHIVKAPRCLESLLSFECKLTHSHTITTAQGVPSSGVVFGEVVGIVAKEEILKETTGGNSGGFVVDTSLFKPVSRLGGWMYARTTAAYEIPRPSAP